MSQNSATATGLTWLAGASASAESAAASVGSAAALLLRLPRALRQALSGLEAVAAKQPVPVLGLPAPGTVLPSGSTCSDLPCERGFRLIWISSKVN